MGSDLENCSWNVYDEKQGTGLGTALLTIDIFAVLLSFWTLFKVLRSSLTKKKSYWMLVNLLSVIFIRGVLGLFIGYLVFQNRWIFPESWLLYFGFLQQFTSVYLIEGVTLICIERYVIAKYLKKGWKITSSTYILFICLCLLISSLYAIPMLYSIGKYDWDITCSKYDVSLELPSELGKKYVLLSILFLQSVKPVLVMFSMFYWARQIEDTICDTHNLKEQIDLTKSASSMAKHVVALSIPSFTMSFYIILYGPAAVSVGYTEYFGIARLLSEFIHLDATGTLLYNNKHILREVAPFLFMDKIKEK